MNTDDKAKRFLTAFYVFLAVNAAWSTIIVASQIKEAVVARAVVSIALYGTLGYFLWKKSDGVRVFLGIVQTTIPIIFFAAEFLSSYRMDLASHFRMAGAVAFGAALLFWKPMRDYTSKKQPIQSPQTTRAFGLRG